MGSLREGLGPGLDGRLGRDERPFSLQPQTLVETPKNGSVWPNFAIGARSARMTASGVRRAKAAFFSGFKSHPATIAPAGRNRSSHGGNEMAEAFGIAVSRIGEPRLPLWVTCRR